LQMHLQNHNQQQDDNMQKMTDQYVATKQMEQIRRAAIRSMVPPASKQQPQGANAPQRPPAPNGMGR